jgi:Sulfotransferase family
MSTPILLTGMHRSGGSWVAKMIEGGGGVVHVNEPFNRRHPPGLTPGILRVPPPRAYQHVGPHNEAEHLAGFRDMLDLRYGLAAELRANHGVYDLVKAAKYQAAFVLGRARGLRPLIDDPYMVFAAEWLAERLDCRVVMLVRHPAGIVSSLKRIGDGWADNLPDIASQPELVRRYLSSYATELERAAGQPLDPVAHGALLWLLIHSAIAQQVARHPEFIVVRYEDLAGDPLPQFRDLYGRLGLDFNARAEKAVRAGSMAGDASRRSAWGRVGMARTAYQPMESKANAWAWRERLTTREITDVIGVTRPVASQFYSPDELAVRLEPAA